MKTKLAITRCTTYNQKEVESAVRKSLDLLGGLTKFIKPQSRVLIKPNLLMAKGPEFGITTHPEVVRAVIRVLKEIKCLIFVGDGPSVWGKHIENVDEVYRQTGIESICKQEGVALVKFEKKRWRDKFPLTSWLDECDHLINIPKFKTHEFTLLTGAIKNLFGLVSGTFKTELHKNYFKIEDFSKILVDIFEQAKPALTIVDAITAMEADGPATGGKIIEKNLLITGSDCVAIDTLLAMAMGVKPFDVLSTKQASMRGLGKSNLEDIEILGESIEAVTNQAFILPQTSSISKKLPESIIRLASKLIKYYPCVERDNCIKCEACIKACPKKIIKMDKKGIKIDYSECIACFCCQEVCPATAIKVKKSLFARMIGL